MPFNPAALIQRMCMWSVVNVHSMRHCAANMQCLMRAGACMLPACLSLPHAALHVCRWRVDIYHCITCTGWHATHDAHVNRLFFPIENKSTRHATAHPAQKQAPISACKSKRLLRGNGCLQEPVTPSNNILQTLSPAARRSRPSAQSRSTAHDLP